MAFDRWISEAPGRTLNRQDMHAREYYPVLVNKLIPDINPDINPESNRK